MVLSLRPKAIGLPGLRAFADGAYGVFSWLQRLFWDLIHRVGSDC